MLTRRGLVLGACGLAGAALVSLPFGRRLAAAAGDGAFEVTRTEAEWRALLTPEQYAVLREEATERAFTSPLNHEARAGIYHCAGCDNALYESDKKYDSGTGWPSFWDVIPGAVGNREDRTFIFMVRTEEHCARCGSHLGHVFDDGPPPTGRRHCINGVALAFRPFAGQVTG